MDALSDVLRTTRLTGGVFLHAEFSDPWCIGARVAPEDIASFLGATSDIIAYHYVLEGRLRVKAGDAPALELAPGEVVLFPRNDSHLLGGDLSLPPISADDVVKPPQRGGLARIRVGGGGARTRIICGFLGGEKLAKNPIVSTLPSVLHLDVRAGGSAEWIRSTFHYAADEIAAGRMGSETVMAKLSELLFVEAIRRYVEKLPEGQSGWLAGLRDPYVSRALALLHGRLSNPWTVDDLGREVGLSRSALADRFGELIGLPPMQYLTNWRMQVAAQELRKSNKSIMQVALEVGYDSEAAFSRAFKRVMDTPPATWRRQPD
jgi:AraC-like DNA-binding protein